MPGLFHDRSLRGARNGCGRGVPGPEGMARILGRIETRPGCQFLGDTRHVDTAEAAALDAPVGG